MGLELDVFVYPERISPELFCPICTNVLENPVQTPSEHLFCEDELLEWMLRSEICPVTKQKLDPSTIVKPGRIVLNMLSELERFCPNKESGCEWQGKCSNVPGHYKSCAFKGREELVKELAKKEGIVEKLKEKVVDLECRLSYQIENSRELSSRLAIAERKLKVYDTFFQNSVSEDGKISSGESK